MMYVSLRLRGDDGVSISGVVVLCLLPGVAMGVSVMLCCVMYLSVFVCYCVVMCFLSLVVMWCCVCPGVAMESIRCCFVV